MLEIVCGVKGKGKTKDLLNIVNNAVMTANGNVVYLDKSQKHMYELSNKVRLINVMDYPVKSCDMFIGFVCGIISQDNDLEEMYVDSFLTVAQVSTTEEVANVIAQLDAISERYGVHLILSISLDLDELPEIAKSKVIVSL